MGNELPELRTETLGTVDAVSCVMLKNSLDAPVTRTLSPTLTGTGQLVQKTKMPSDVAGSASTSASSSWIKKPRSCPEPWVWYAPTTMASTVNVPAAELSSFVWISWMSVTTTPSSLTIVPWPCPSTTVAPVTFVTLTKKVSSGSATVSPVTKTENV